MGSRQGRRTGGADGCDSRRIGVINAVAGMISVVAVGLGGTYALQGRVGIHDALPWVLGGMAWFTIWVAVGRARERSKGTHPRR